MSFIDGWLQAGANPNAGKILDDRARAMQGSGAFTGTQWDFGMGPPPDTSGNPLGRPGTPAGSTTPTLPPNPNARPGRGTTPVTPPATVPPATTPARQPPALNDPMLYQNTPGRSKTFDGTTKDQAPGGGWNTGPNGENPFGEGGMNFAHAFQNAGNNDNGQRQNSPFGSWWNSSDNGDQATWAFSSTNPRLMGNGMIMSTNGSGEPLTQVGEGEARFIKDPSKVKWDKEFGWVTEQSNLNNNEDWLDRVMGYLPAALGAFFMGGAGMGMFGPEAGVEAGTTVGGTAAGTVPQFAVPPPINPITAPAIGGLGPAATAAGGLTLPSLGGALSTGRTILGGASLLSGLLGGGRNSPGSGATPGGGTTTPGGGTDDGGLNLNGLLNTGLNLYNNNQMINSYRGQVDNFINRGDYNAQYRPGQLSELNNFLLHPDQALSSQAYQDLRARRLENNVSRPMAARGLSLSGNEMGELNKQGTEMDYNEIDRRIKQLTTAANLGDPSSMARAGISSLPFLYGMMGGRNASLNYGLNNGLSRPNTPGGNKSPADIGREVFAQHPDMSDEEIQAEIIRQTGGEDTYDENQWQSIMEDIRHSNGSTIPNPLSGDPNPDDENWWNYFWPGN